MKKKISLPIRDERGVITIMMVIMMAAFVGIMALVIDLGHLYSVKNELQNSADAAALAGARTLMPMTGPGAPPWPMVDPPPCGDAFQAAKDTAWVNQTQGGAERKNITIEDQDVVTGVWDFKPVGTKTGTFAPTACVANSGTNAIKVTVRMRADLSQGSVIMTFAKIFGVSTVDTSAMAIAAVGSLGTLPKGSPGGFLAADDDFMKTAENNWKKGNTNQVYYIVLGPAGGQTGWQFADNGAWSVPSGVKNINGTVNSEIDSGTTQDISVGNSVDLANGTMNDVLKNLQKAITAAGSAGLDSNIYGVYGDGHVGGDSWNQSATVNNFWEVQLTQVWQPSEFNKDPQAQAILDAMYPDANAQKKIVGMIAFKMLGPSGLEGQPGPQPPSNTYSMVPKLVDNDSLH